MPVVTPSAASMLTVKLVWCDEVLSRTIGGRPSWAQRSRVSDRQTRPRAWVTMKLMSAGRTSSAAMIRSPSFSRSSSSTMTTMRPARSSSSSSGMGAKGMGLRPGLGFRGSGGFLGLSGGAAQALEVAGDEVDFEVHGVAGTGGGEGGVGDRVRDQRDFAGFVLHGIDRQAHAVHADRALARDVLRQFRGHAEAPALRARVLAHVEHAADAVDVAADQVAAEAVGRQHRALEVERRALAQAAE